MSEADTARFANAVARAALAGYELRTDPLGAFYATRWGQMRMFESLDEIKQWVVLMTGKRAA